MPVRCALTLSLALTGCFGPTGSAATRETTDTTAETTNVANTSTTDPNSTGPDPTTGATGSVSTSSTTSTDPTAASSTTASVEPVCGNMIKEDGEECDHGGTDDGGTDDGCTADCRIDGRLIFATASLHPGNVGLAQADQICRDLGKTYFPLDRTFVAWLSVNSMPMFQRLNGNSLPYRLPGLELVFNNSDELLQAMIQHPVDQDVEGTTIEGSVDCDAGPLVWTGTSSDGKAGLNCNDWTSTTGQGKAGNARAQDTQWTDSCGRDCSQQYRLYCIQNMP